MRATLHSDHVAFERTRTSRHKSTIWISETVTAMEGSFSKVQYEETLTQSKCGSTYRDAIIGSTVKDCGYPVALDILAFQVVRPPAPRVMPVPKKTN